MTEPIEQPTGQSTNQTFEEKVGSLGEHARTRRSPSIYGGVAAAGAIVAAGGATLLGADAYTSDGSTAIGLILSILVVIAGYLTLTLLDQRVKAGGVALAAIGTALVVGFLFVDNVDSASGPLVLLVAAYTVQIFVPPTKGEQVMVVGALGSFWLLILDSVSDGAEVFVGSSFSDSSDDSTAIASLVIGVVFLAIAWQLDKLDYRGFATGFVVVGDAAFVIGVLGSVGLIGSVGVIGVLILAAGAALVFVGTSGERRLTSWLGATGLVVGVAVLIGWAFESADSVTGPAIVALLVGAAMVAGTAFIDLDQLMAFNSDKADPSATEDTETADDSTSDESLPSASWQPDPQGRHEHRWWNGSDWTDSVADGGVSSTDPLGP